MKLLVTGGAGFIGSCFVRRLLQEKLGFSVTNLDALTYAGNPANVAAVAQHPGYRFIEGNICDRKLIEKILGSEKFDALVNFAAESHVDRSIVKPGQFIETNVMGTQVLLESAKKAGIKIFLQVSTDEVYGSLDEVGNKQKAFRETAPLNPSNPYSASKASADLLCLAFHKTHGFPVMISRCVNNYGPYQYPEKFIPVVIQKALRDEKLPIYGTGKNIRSWIHVNDHCEALLQLLENPQPAGIFNIATGEETDNLSLAKEILKILGKDEKLVGFVEDRLGHDWHYAIDAKKLTDHCGWKPKIKFRDGLPETVNWYVKNQAWVDGALKKV